MENLVPKAESSFELLYLFLHHLISIYRTCPYNRTPRPFPEKNAQAHTAFSFWNSQNRIKFNLPLLFQQRQCFQFCFPDAMCEESNSIGLNVNRASSPIFTSWLKCYDVYECEQRTRISLHICAVWLAYSLSASTMGMYMLIREGSSLRSYEVAGVRRLNWVFAFRTCEKAPFLKSNSCHI